ncbi:MAG: carboxypeptidase regulatory-like domain-containing protein, partial [Gemmatimonadota bacterium]|nr:carboxypeptidase regulatory-like domain-containing protein [Gemmatimonadota bacterium]
MTLLLAGPVLARSLIAEGWPGPGALRGREIAASERADTGATATVTGTVYDSVAHAPLAGADVQLVELKDRSRAYTVRADSLGRFRIDSVRPGDYAAGFFHAALDALGIEPPLQAARIRAGNDNVLALVIPGPVAMMRALCPARPAGDSAGAVAGSVRGAESGAPVKGAKVIVSWLELFIDSRGIVTQQRRVPVATGENGDYRICGVPGADTVLASVEAPGRQSGVIEVAIPSRGITRQDFTLGDSTSAVALSPDS